MTGRVFCLDKHGYTSWENWYQEELINDSCCSPEFHFRNYRKSEYKLYAASLLKFGRSYSKENTRANLLPKLKQGKMTRSHHSSSSVSAHSAFSWLWKIKLIFGHLILYDGSLSLAMTVICSVTSLLFRYSWKAVSSPTKARFILPDTKCPCPCPVPAPPACAAAALPTSCGTGLCRELSLKLGNYPFSWRIFQEKKKKNQFGL